MHTATSTLVNRLRYMAYTEHQSEIVAFASHRVGARVVLPSQPMYCDKIGEEVIL